LRFARKFAALTWGDRALVVEALAWLVAARAALWVVPFGVLRGRRVRVAARRPGVEVERLVWAVGAASVVVPRCTCLVRAMAGERMLGRHGYGSAVRIGVRKAGGEFEAHAWLEGEVGEGFVVMEGRVFGAEG
jgi:hypothetical protein